MADSTTYQLTDNYGRTIPGNYWIPGGASNPNGSWAPIPTGATSFTSPAGTDPKSAEVAANSINSEGMTASSGYTQKYQAPAADVVPTPTHRDASGNLIYTGVDGLQHDQNGNTYQNGTVTPKAAVTQTTTPPAAPQQTQQQAQQPTQQPATQTNTQSTPTMPWASGHTGADVKALQDMLVSKGFMTAAQQATGPGIFGPQTQAALAAYQMQNGGPSASTSPQNGSGGTSNGGQSTYTNQPATATQPAKSAVQSVIDDYTTAYTALGLSDIKSEYQKYVQQQTDLTNKQNAEKQNIDNNPWMTQGIKDSTKAQIDRKYQSQQDTLTHQTSLLDSLYKQGQQEVSNIVDKATAIDAAQVKAAADLAQKQVDAVNALKLEKVKASDAVNLKETTPGKAPVTPKNTPTSPNGPVYTKGKLSNNEWVNMSLSRLGFSYEDALSKVPAGKVGVIDNKTGKFGAINPLDFSTTQYTKI